MFYCLEYSKIYVHVCSCMCMHVPMCAHTYTCTYVCVHTCTHTYPHACTREDLWAHACACAHMRLCACPSVAAYMCGMCAHTPPCTHTGTVCLHLRVHTCTHVPTCEHLWTHVCACAACVSARVWLCTCVMCVHARLCICPCGAVPRCTHTHAHVWGMCCGFRLGKDCPDEVSRRGLRPRSPVSSTCSWVSGRGPGTGAGLPRCSRRHPRSCAPWWI